MSNSLFLFSSSSSVLTWSSRRHRRNLSLVRSVWAAAKSLYWPPPEYQDLSTRPDWPVKKAIVDLPIKLKGNSKRISGNLLSPFLA